MGLGLGAALAVSAPSPSPAAEGAAFLVIPQGARAMGLANAFTTQSDPTSMWYNASGLAGLSGRHVSLTHSRLFADTNLDLLGYVHPLGTANGGGRPVSGVLGLGAIHLGNGALEGRDAGGARSGNFSASDLAMNLSYARVLNLHGNVGLGVEVIRQEIADESAVGVGVNLGGIYHLESMPVTVGASILHLGPPMKFLDESFQLPLTVRLGASHLLWGMAHLAVDFQHRPYDKKISVSLGTEYWVLPQIALRAGYLGIVQGASSLRANQGLQLSDPGGLGLGIGARIARHLSVDYSFTPESDLGNSHRFTLGVKW